MPVARVLFGRPVNITMPPRRFQTVFGLTLFFALAIILVSKTAPVDVPSVAIVTDHLPEAITNPHIPHIPHLPQAINPFRGAVHKPPEQANSSIGETTWHIDWRWKNPFSSSVTLDENRAVLPPLKQRPTVYTYYEPKPKDSKAASNAEDQLLLQWRRAWWAQGFKPIVLGRQEALNNPLYKKIQQLKLDDTLELELSRWLAWGNMGTGVLANWLAYPMAPPDNALLSFLRRGQFPILTRFDGLGNGLFCGEKAAINDAINKAIEHKSLKEATGMSDKIFTDLFSVDSEHDGVAFYDMSVIEKKYQTVSKSLSGSDHASGMLQLAELVNSHLHNTWQNSFPAGIAVVKPLAEHMTTLVDAALDIARNLTQCPWSPEPASCPPNRPRCKKCVSTQPLAITTPPTFQNKTKQFHIGVVPHPYTTTSLMSQKADIDARQVRRQGMQNRDIWLRELTKDLIGTGPSSQARIVSFKEAVAGDYGVAHGIWLNAEKESTQDLDWVFGFDIWREGLDRHDSETPVPGPERRPPKPKTAGPVLSEKELEDEKGRLRKAREVLKSKAKDHMAVREAVEAWHMADAEVWKFARAFAARKVMERRKFEQEEQAFHGSEHSKGHWGRWFD